MNKFQQICIRRKFIIFGICTLLLLPQGVLARAGDLKWAVDTYEPFDSSPAIGLDGTVYGRPTMANFTR